MSDQIKTTVMIVVMLMLSTFSALATPRYTQQGKDCIVSDNGSARVAHNTKCPEPPRPRG